MESQRFSFRALLLRLPATNHVIDEGLKSKSSDSKPILVTRARVQVELTTIKLMRYNKRTGCVSEEPVSDRWVVRG